MTVTLLAFVSAVAAGDEHAMHLLGCGYLSPHW